MFTKPVFVFTLLGLAVQIRAHALIAPALGVNGAGTRNDVQRPTNASMCGSVNITTALPSSGMVRLQADGTFSVNITNFNGGEDGSRQVTATVDGTASGTNFTQATVIQNGDLAPTSVGSQTLTIQMPSDLTCAGGPARNLCIASFKTAAGFGNCVVVQEAITNSCKAGSRKARKTSSDLERKVVLDARATGTRAARVMKRAWEDWTY